MVTITTDSLVMYDFKTPADRLGTGSIKMDFAPEPVKGSGLVPLTIADQEFRVAPEIIDAIKADADRGIFGYTYADNEYRSAVDGWMRRRHNWDTTDYKLVITNGVVSALSHAIDAFTDKTDGVVIQPPVYMQFENAIKGSGRRIIENPLINRSGRYEIDFDDLDKKTKQDDVKLLFLCSPHNPVGRVWTEQELKKLGEICIRNGIIIIADEIHNDLILNGAKHVVFASLPEMAEHAVTCTAVSKTFNLAGLSCSNIFIKNPSLAEKFSKTANRTGGCVPYFARAATIAAYTRGERWLDELNSVIASNFELLYSFLSDRLPMITATRAEGTYLAWLDMRALKMDDNALQKLMLDNYLALDDGFLFGTGGSGFERWNLALPQAQLADALARLEKAVKSTNKF